ncbi:uncharacterized protein PAN0_002d1260 [Moesziomyces antarcticus]|uniref:Uncharacterized protein n=1 Tax=Pseudozyma antarctica TaxID=84753 RepID=A0A5C3FJ30_PSEA2|nr:uncharacterized protein PAN0_002d1260 [Moesziomyces antarcticus]GAK63058.1 hypothetical protein PAN0_002d1260 [Moesziomyces antarcticus]SPO43459.1 uncharacterized protein PSANT_01144 [Moesziomyces antarcticus]
MRPRRSPTPPPMPALVVLVPSQDVSVPDTASSSPRRKSPSHSSLAKASFPSKHPRPLSRDSTKHHLHPSAASSSSLSSVPPSSPRLSSSSASATAGSSTSGARTKNARRSSVRYHPIDFSNPFGEDADLSAKRAAPANQGPYTCNWRLRDKKGLLDRKGHVFCRCKLMTADLLAKHVLTHHIAPAAPSTTNQGLFRKVACRWDHCFNRHYEPSELAAHLVHDHFTHQMGLKYACLVQNCSATTLLTTRTALERHHAQYHAAHVRAAQLRPTWEPKPVEKDRKHASHLLAQLREYDALPGPSRVRIAVSDRMNPKLDVSSPAINREHAREFKKRYMNPAMIQPGPDQKGEPWLSLHRRLQRSVDVSAARQAADQAIFEGTCYDDTNLARSHACTQAVVELSEPPSLSALKQGIIAGQPYISSAASSSGAVAKPTTGEETLVLPNQPCEVALPRISAQEGVESIGASSLASIDREMQLDDALETQRRWAQKVYKIRPPPSRSIARSSGTATFDLEDDTDLDEPCLPEIEIYHPASRVRFLSMDGARSSPPPRSSPPLPFAAASGPTGSGSKTSETSSSVSTSVSTSSERSHGYVSTPPSQYGSTETADTSISVKRERNDPFLDRSGCVLPPTGSKRRAMQSSVYLPATPNKVKEESTFVDLKLKPSRANESSPLSSPIPRSRRRRRG